MTGVLTAISSCIAEEARRLHGFDADGKGAVNGLDEVRPGLGQQPAGNDTAMLTHLQGRFLARVA